MPAYYLTALTPPGNIERIVTDLQKTIFAHTNHPSSLALPPLVPLAIHRQEPEAEALISQSRASAVQAGEKDVDIPFRFGRLSYQDPGLHLDVVMPPLWHRLIAGRPNESEEEVGSGVDTEQAYTDTGDACRPRPYAGFYLGEVDVTSIPMPTAMKRENSWRFMDLVCLHMHVEEEYFWKGIRYESVWELPGRAVWKRLKGRPGKA